MKKAAALLLALALSVPAARAAQVRVPQQPSPDKAMEHAKGKVPQGYIDGLAKLKAEWKKAA